MYDDVGSRDQLRGKLFVSIQSCLPVVFAITILLPYTMFTGATGKATIVVRGDISNVSGRVLCSSFCSTSSNTSRTSAMFFGSKFNQLATFRGRCGSNEVAVVVHRGVDVI